MLVFVLRQPWPASSIVISLSFSQPHLSRFRHFLHKSVDCPRRRCASADVVPLCTIIISSYCCNLCCWSFYRRCLCCHCLHWQCLCHRLCLLVPQICCTFCLTVVCLHQAFAGTTVCRCSSVFTKSLVVVLLLVFVDGADCLPPLAWICAVSGSCHAVLWFLSRNFVWFVLAWPVTGCDTGLSCLL